MRHPPINSFRWTAKPLPFSVGYKATDVGVPSGYCGACWTKRTGRSLPQTPYLQALNGAARLFVHDNRRDAPAAPGLSYRALGRARCERRHASVQEHAPSEDDDPERRWAEVSGILLGALLVFAVGAFGLFRPAGSWGHLPGWILAARAAWTIRRIFRPYRLHGSILLVPWPPFLLCGIWQIAFRASPMLFRPGTAILNWGTYGVLFVLSLNVSRRSGSRSRFCGTCRMRGPCSQRWPCSAFCHSGNNSTGSSRSSGVPFGPFVNPRPLRCFRGVGCCPWLSLKCPGPAKGRSGTPRWGPDLCVGHSRASRAGPYCQPGSDRRARGSRRAQACVKARIRPLTGSLALSL